MLKKPRKPNPLFEKCKQLTDLFLKIPPQAGEWANEIKVSKILYKQHPQIEFWESIDLGFKVNSLVFFLTQDGKEEIKIAEGHWNVELPERKRYNLTSDNEAKNTIPSSPQQKTLLNFLKS
jgi:hypothetical protein